MTYKYRLQLRAKSVVTRVADNPAFQRGPIREKRLREDVRYRF